MGWAQRPAWALSGSCRVPGRAWVGSSKAGEGEGGLGQGRVSDGVGGYSCWLRAAGCSCCCRCGRREVSEQGAGLGWGMFREVQHCASAEMCQRAH